jgi:hypothetical protein
VVGGVSRLALLGAGALSPNNGVDTPPEKIV